MPFPALWISRGLVQYIGDVTYVPVTGTYPAGYYWGINVTYATYGLEPLIPASYAGIVDTGTTRAFIA